MKMSMIMRACLWTLLAASAAGAGVDPGPQLAVAFADRTDPAGIDAWVAAGTARGCTLVYRFSTIPAVLMSVPPGDTALPFGLAQDPQVVFVESGRAVALAGVPDDALFGEQWWADNDGSFGFAGEDIDLPRAWDHATGDGTVVVAVVDHGVDVSHPDLAANCLPGRSFVGGVPGGSPGVPAHPHGTACAGVIGAVGNNGIGIAGINWHVKILPLAFYTTIEAAAAIDYAVSAGARVISNSWGIGGASDPILAMTINAATAAGVVVVNAAGNYWRDLDVPGNELYPASYNLPLNLAVGASASNGNYSGLSNYGASTVDIAAPGDKVLTCGVGGTYAKVDGTSVAAPLVAGAIALLMSQFPAAAPQWIVDRVLDNAEQLGQFDGLVAHGRRLNVARLFDLADRIPPAAPGNLHVAGFPVAGFPSEGIVGTSAALSWLAPGDDGPDGSIDHYELWLTVDSAPAYRLVGTCLPVAAGQEQEYVLDGLGYGTACTFRVVAVDDARNRGQAEIAFTTPGPPVIAVDDSYVFAAATTGEVLQSMTWVRNPGPSMLAVEIDGFAASGWLRVVPERFLVAPRDSQQVHLDIDASGLCGPVVSALLRFDNNSLLPPPAPQLSCIVQILPAPEVAGVGDVDFGIVDAGATGLRQIAIRNAGCVDLHVSAIGFAGPGPFSAEAVPGSIAAGDSLVVDLSFGSLVTGVHEDVLLVTSDAPFSPILSIPVRGETRGAAGAVPGEDAVPSLACYPNPFNPGTTFSFAAGANRTYTVSIYDLRGALVRVLEGTTLADQVTMTTWSGRTRRGEPAAAGTYYCVLRLDGRRAGPPLAVSLIR